MSSSSPQCECSRRTLGQTLTVKPMLIRELLTRNVMDWWDVDDEEWEDPITELVYG